MAEVRATIYSRSTPLSIRQVISGGDQNVQAAVVPVLLSRVLQVTLDELAKDSGLAVKDAVKLAITKTGFRRPTTTKQSWGPRTGRRRAARWRWTPSRPWSPMAWRPPSPV